MNDQTVWIRSGTAACRTVTRKEAREIIEADERAINDAGIITEIRSIVTQVLYDGVERGYLLIKYGLYDLSTRQPWVQDTAPVEVTPSIVISIDDDYYGIVPVLLQMDETPDKTSAEYQRLWQVWDSKQNRLYHKLERFMRALRDSEVHPAFQMFTFQIFFHYPNTEFGHTYYRRTSRVHKIYSVESGGEGKEHKKGHKKGHDKDHRKGHDKGHGKGHRKDHGKSHGARHGEGSSINEIRSTAYGGTSTGHGGSGHGGSRQGEPSTRHGDRNSRHGETSSRHGASRHGATSSGHGGSRHGEASSRHGDRSSRHRERDPDGRIGEWAMTVYRP
ncbi:hypothetical protein F5Y07DRAFT_327225 [Xylaria sp. FL0933]|nr:hypothetical protein F5Y07DRAFT_327225 [Xylaria sp. FL0933]